MWKICIRPSTSKKNILAKPTGTYKAEALLDDAIKTSLSVGYPDSFYKLLKVMKDTQSNACIQLVDSMISDGIPSELVTKFNIRSDGVKPHKSADHGESPLVTFYCAYICIIHTWVPHDARFMCVSGQEKCMGTQVCYLHDQSSSRLQPHNSKTIGLVSTKFTYFIAFIIDI